MRKDVEAILKKYEAKLSSEISSETGKISSEYLKFKKELIPEPSWYERLCKNIGKSFKVKVKEEDKKKLQEQIETAHLDITPEEASGLSVFVLFSVIAFSFLITGIIYLISGNFSFSFLLLLLFAGIFLFFFLNNYPKRLAQKWRLKTSSQMVPCILYVVIYMRHTSNLERAVRFASQHLPDPIALDLKKVFWNVETGKYSTMKESLDAYLNSWRDYSLEFVESFHLIEGSLYEPSEARRIALLEKSLEVMLDGVYDKMLHYAHDVKSPITNIYMLGIVLPTLGLALLPLASALVGGLIKWYHVLIFFNLLVPFFVFYMTDQILSKRPGGYGETEMLEKNPDYVYYKSKKPYLISLIISLPLFILGILPLLFQYTSLPSFLGLERDYSLNNLGLSFLSGMKLFDFKTLNGSVVGPFGILALILSLFFVLAIALFFSIAYKLKTQRLIKTRIETKKLENEFASSLFQLGNRLGDGIPAEIAFGRVAESLRGTPTADFFATVNMNIQQVGMSVEQAIFNKTRGAIIYFPSQLIKTSMRILLESVKKGLQVAARALISISTYVKNINKVNERLKDLLADVSSSMKSNISFLAPMLAGIVVGLAAMITTILSKLQVMLSTGSIGEETVIGGLGTAKGIIQMFDVTKMIPPYYLQIAVGIYIIEIVFILSSTLVTINSGVDKLTEKSEISKNLTRAIGLYFFITLISIIALTLLAGIAVGNLGT